MKLFWSLNFILRTYFTLFTLAIITGFPLFENNNFYSLCLHCSHNIIDWKVCTIVRIDQGKHLFYCYITRTIFCCCLENTARALRPYAHFTLFKLYLLLMASPLGVLFEAPILAEYLACSAKLFWKLYFGHSVYLFQQPFFVWRQLVGFGVCRRSSIKGKICRNSWQS